MKIENKNFSNAVVNSIIRLVVFFTLLSLAVYCHIGAAPDALVVAFFAFATGELWALAKIKRDKINSNGGKEEEDNG